MEFKLAFGKAKKGKKFKPLYIFGIVLSAICSLGIYAQIKAGGSFEFDDILMLVVLWTVMVVGAIILAVVCKNTNQGEAIVDSGNTDDAVSDMFEN